MITLLVALLCVLAAFGIAALWMLRDEQPEPLPTWGRVRLERLKPHAPVRLSPNIEGIKEQLADVAYLEMLAARRRVLDTPQGKIWHPQGHIHTSS